MPEKVISCPYCKSETQIVRIKRKRPRWAEKDVFIPINYCAECRIYFKIVIYKVK